MTEPQFEQRGSGVLLWALWVGLGFATVGEVVLFTMMDPGGAHGAEAVGTLPLSQLATVVGLAALMAGLAGAATWARIGGGGFPTAMISWVLLKGVAISGLVVYQLADYHGYYWPFLIVFVAGMLLLHPRLYMEDATGDG